jgi:hypothetical protein
MINLPILKDDADTQAVRKLAVDIDTRVTVLENANTSPISASGVFSASVITDWASYTPTFQGEGSPTAVTFTWRRVGGNVEIFGKYTCGTPTAVEAQIGLPSGLISDAGIPTIEVVGYMVRGSADNNQITILAEPSKTYLTVGSAVNGALTKLLGTTFVGVGIVISFFASIPISGWSANAQNTVTATQSSQNAPMSANFIQPMSAKATANVTYQLPNTSGTYQVYIPASYLVAGSGGPWTLSINGSGSSVSVPISASGDTLTSGDLFFSIYLSPTGQAVSSGWKKSGSNANGSYIMFNDGTIEEWGFITTTSSDHLVPLPVSYINTTYNIETTGQYIGGTWKGSSPRSTPSPITMNDFHVIAYDNGAAYNGPVYWRTIGRWK